MQVAASVPGQGLLCLCCGRHAPACLCCGRHAQLQPAYVVAGMPSYSLLVPDLGTRHHRLMWCATWLHVASCGAAGGRHGGALLAPT